MRLEVCDCHGEPMYWEKRRKKWRCAIKKRESFQRWYEAHPERGMEGYRTRTARHADRRRGIVAAERLQRGDCCQDCGNKENLQWHHRVKSTKDFPIAKATQMPDADLVAELKKCDLVCPKCHSRRHQEMWTA